jgi:hypothetical protein
MRLRASIPLLLVALLPAQVIEFESNGLKYQTLTRNGVTVMYAPMPNQVRNYAIVQAAVSNGSPAPIAVRPEDFTFVRADGSSLRAASAKDVVDSMLEHGGRTDVIRLINAYEAALYGMARLKSTNGYEQRRQAAQAEITSTKLKAAAATSAIAFVFTKLAGGQSTDGAVFFPTEGKPLGPGRLVVKNPAGEYSFNAD